MSDKFRTIHNEMVLKSGDMENCLENFTYHLEEPRVGQSYPNYYAAKLASNSVKVVLSGTGGDEAFLAIHGVIIKHQITKNFEDYINKYYHFWQRLVPNKDINNLFLPISSDIKKVWTRNIFKNVFKSSLLSQTPEGYINQSLYFEAKTFLHGLLVVEDKLSMAHGIEFRVPFLDNDLVDFAQKYPKYKLKNIDKIINMDENEVSKFTKTGDGKLILRKAMRHIPDKIYKAVKQGFSSPDESWFKGEYIDFVKQKLLNRDANILLNIWIKI